MGFAALWIILAALGTTSARADLESRRTPVSAAVQRVQATVVSISSEKRAGTSSRWPYSGEEAQRPRVSGMGSGVIIDPRGYILTNHHVVDKVQGIEVHLHDGTVLRASVVQQDPALDLAMLKVEAGRPLAAIAVGSSADVMVGETVITIVNAFGYENTVSAGIVSYVGRNVTLADDQVYRNLIQTDACINPGNSGGPLINLDGELIGINVAVRAGAQGIGFALPIDDVKRVAAEMISTRRLAATWHGLVSAEAVGGKGRRVMVSEVQPGSPAQAAGVQPGDQVVKVGDLEVNSPLDIERGLLEVRPGQKADLVVRRGGQVQTIGLEMAALQRLAPDAADQVLKTLGVKVDPVSKEYVSAVSAKFRGGLYVHSVTPGSPAARASIQKGDILVGLNDGTQEWETIRPDNVLFILKKAKTDRAQNLLYYLVRRNEFVQGNLSLADMPVATTRR